MSCFTPRIRNVTELFLPRPGLGPVCAGRRDSWNLEQPVRRSDTGTARLAIYYRHSRILWGRNIDLWDSKVFVCHAVTCDISHVTCHTLNAYIDPCEMLSSFIFMSMLKSHCLLVKMAMIFLSFPFSPIMNDYFFVN